MDFSAAIHLLKEGHLHRSLRTLSSPQSRQVSIDGRNVLLFSSNSYLGLAEEPAIVESAVRAMEQYGVGAGGSRLMAGNMTCHMELEADLASFMGTESCVVFTSGYTANLGAISAIAGKDSVIFSDALNHASIIDGCRLAKGRTVIFKHNDIDDLVLKIRETRPACGLIVTDSVFSMAGDMARLPDLVQVKNDWGLMLMVDDAHATGVLGVTGRGSVEHFKLIPSDVDILMGTLSKAIPSEGGFIGGTTELCDYLKNTARSFIYTTALSPSTAAAAHAGLLYVRDHPERVRQLQNNARYMAARLSSLGLHTTDGQTPIIPVIIGEEDKAATLSQRLLEYGIFVPAIRYPSVAKGQAQLRFTVMATHTQQDINFAVDTLKSILC